MIILFDQMDIVKDQWIDTNIHHLPIEKQEKHLKYRLPSMRKQSFLAEVILRMALSEHNIDITDLTKTELGKPYITGQNNFHVNLSHCNQGVAVAIDDELIGVDIHEIRPFNQKLCRKVCVPKEIRRIESATNPAVAFAQVWSEKEAYLKWTGQGIAGGLRNAVTTQETFSKQISQVVTPTYVLSSFGKPEQHVTKINFEKIVKFLQNTTS